MGQVARQGNERRGVQMTLQELITDLKAAGANENTLRLAMNCYELGQKDEREECAKLCKQQEDYGPLCETIWDCAAAIRARGEA